MKTAIKTTLAALLFITALSAKAQDKYDYATVKYVSPLLVGKTGLFISISGKDFERIEVKKSDTKDLSDNTILLNYVQKMTESGWRVINTVTEGGFLTFILEKKRS